MDKKITGIVGYITIVGWLIAYLVGDKEGAKFHLNQALVIAIAELIVGVIANIPVIGLVAGILELALFVLAILGIVYAVQEEEKPLPLIGGIQLLK